MSGISGTIENLLIEDGYIYDFGGGRWQIEGNDHNLYITPRFLTARGLITARTRGPVFNSGENYWKPMDGHLFKMRGISSTFEGCTFYSNESADNSRLLQFANGGTHSVTGCVFIQGTHSVNPGMVSFEWEYSGRVFDNTSATDPSRVDSLTMRNNVFIQRSPAVNYQVGGNPFVYCRPTDALSDGGPAGAYALNPTIDIRDNIGAHILGGTADMTDLQYIIHKTQSVAWSTNNTRETYSANDVWATNPRVFDYRRAAGAISGAAIATRRFIYPSWSDPRSDSLRGLG
jgi:hypothetical protein